MQPHKDRLEALRSDALQARSITPAEVAIGIIVGPVSAIEVAKISTVFFISLPFANTAPSFAGFDVWFTFEGSMPESLGYFNFGF